MILNTWERSYTDEYIDVYDLELAPSTLYTIWIYMINTAQVDACIASIRNQAVLQKNCGSS